MHKEERVAIFFKDVTTSKGLEKDSCNDGVVNESKMEESRKGSYPRSQAPGIASHSQAQNQKGACTVPLNVCSN